MKKNILVVDNFSNTQLGFSDFGLKTVSTHELENLLFSSIKVNYKMDAVEKFVWGGMSNGDCRETITNLVMNLLNKTK